MRGILLLTRAEINRLRRNRRYMIFTVGLPVDALPDHRQAGESKAYGVDFAAYYMVAMATFGAFAGALNGNSIRIAQERKVGWIRQLRLTPLPANGYIVAKIIDLDGHLTMPSVVIVLLLGRFYGGVHLGAAWKWVVIAAIVWLGVDDLRRARGRHRATGSSRTRCSRSRC